MHPSQKERKQKKDGGEKKEGDEWWRDMVTAMVVVVVHAWCFLTQPHLETKSQDSLALEYDNIYA